MMLPAALQRGLDALRMPLAPAAQAKLVAYTELVQKWNRVYNLTAIRDADQMVTYHVLDSLAVAPHIVGTRLIDVGSGAGLPGIPLAILDASRDVTLLESNHKKAAFLEQAVIELGLGNTRVVNERVETWGRGASEFDIVISRAFAGLSEFVTAAGPLCVDTGVIAAMKGVYPYDEIEHLPPGFAIERIVPIAVPGLDAQRHLVLIRRGAA